MKTSRWRISSFSAHGECVAVADLGGKIAVRNSNDEGGSIVYFTRPEMAAWIAGCKAGEFDDLQ